MRKRTLIFAVMALCCVAMSGQAIQQPRKVRAFGDTAAGDSLPLYDILHNNAPGDFPASGVPYATLVGRDGKFVVGAGGFVKAIAGWDFGHPILSADEFITSQIPMTPMDGDGSRFNFSARQTHLFVNFVALPGTENEMGAFVGMNFLNENYIPAVQYAYLRYRGFKVGYDNTVFSDPPCGPPTVDYEGPCSNTCSPVAGLSYSYSHGPWMWSGGIQIPQASFTTITGESRMVYQRVPDVPVGAQYSWDGGNSWIRTSAILRTLTYRDELLRKNRNCMGYGFQLSGAEYFLDRFTLYYQGLWGKGIASMAQDTNGEGLDLVPYGDGGALSPVMVWGGFVSLRCNISRKVAASATYSQLRTYAGCFAGGETSWADLYKYAQYVSANAFFEATSFLEVGLEYIWGRRVNYDGIRCSDNRLQASCQLTF